MTKPKKQSSLKFNTKDCPICFDEINGFNKSVTLPCMHLFCLKCIGKWLHESSSTLCPFCKQRVCSIGYALQSEFNYSTISFPKGFSSSWSLRQKIKELIDNYDSTLLEYYEKLTKQGSIFFTKNVIGYMLYFSDLKIRNIKKNSLINELIEIVGNELENKDKCWDIIKPVISSRLCLVYDDSRVNNLLNDWQKGYELRGYEKLISLVHKVLDPQRAAVLEKEIDLAIYGNDKVNLEYYLENDSTSNSDIKVLISNDNVIHPEICSAILIKMIMSVFLATDMRPTLLRIEYLHGIMKSLDRTFSNQFFWFGMNDCLVESVEYQLINTGFYNNRDLRRSPKVGQIKVTRPMCNLIKHSFDMNEMESLNVGIMNFQKKFITLANKENCFCSYCTPLTPLTFGDILDDEEECDDDVIVVREYVSLADESDSDDIEIISVNYGVHEIFDDPPSTEASPSVPTTTPIQIDNYIPSDSNSQETDSFQTPSTSYVINNADNSLSTLPGFSSFSTNYHPDSSLSSTTSSEPLSKRRRILNYTTEFPGIDFYYPPISFFNNSIITTNNATNIEIFEDGQQEASLSDNLSSGIIYQTENNEDVSHQSNNSTD